MLSFIWIKLATLDLRELSLGSIGFKGKKFSGGRTLLEGVIEFLLVIFAFLN